MILKTSLQTCGVSVQIFSLISRFHSNSFVWFWLGTRALQRSSLLLACINDLPGDVISISTFAEDTTLYSAYDRAR